MGAPFSLRPGNQLHGHGSRSCWWSETPSLLTRGAVEPRVGLLRKTKTGEGGKGFWWVLEGEKRKGRKRKEEEGGVADHQVRRPWAWTASAWMFCFILYWFLSMSVICLIEPVYLHMMLCFSFILVDTLVLPSVSGGIPLWVWVWRSIVILKHFRLSHLFWSRSTFQKCGFFLFKDFLGPDFPILFLSTFTPPVYLFTYNWLWSIMVYVSSLEELGVWTVVTKIFTPNNILRNTLSSWLISGKDRSIKCFALAETREAAITPHQKAVVG